MAPSFGGQKWGQKRAQNRRPQNALFSPGDHLFCLGELRPGRRGRRKKGAAHSKLRRNSYCFYLHRTKGKCCQNLVQRTEPPHRTSTLSRKTRYYHAPGLHMQHTWSTKTPPANTSGQCPSFHSASIERDGCRKTSQRSRVAGKKARG